MWLQTAIGFKLEGVCSVDAPDEIELRRIQLCFVHDWQSGQEKWVVVGTVRMRIKGDSGCLRDGEVYVVAVQVGDFGLVCVGKVWK